MTSPGPRFPDYGDDGDLAGARRGRKAFRLCVAALVLLTAFSWYAEDFLRYNQAETNFLRGITQRRESARVFLQSAIKLDAESGDKPTPKYTQALAVRQEDDVALDTYARAFNMDPTNSLFAIRYACKLFLLGRPSEARDVFVKARNLPPPNALPRYLQAAAVAQQAEGPGTLRDALVIVSRANNTRDPLVFPKPIWFSGYPQRGIQYAFLSREIYTETCAPLYTLAQRAVSTVRRDAQFEHAQDARTWLEQIDRMGDRLVRDSQPPGVLQAIAGVTIQAEATSALAQLYSGPDQKTDAVARQLTEHEAKLRQALEILNEFENSRDQLIAAIQAKYDRPLWLFLKTLLVLVGVYLAARGLHAVLRYRKSAWTVPHSSLGKCMLGGGVTTLFLLLAIESVLQRLPGGQEGYLTAISSAWWTIVAIVVCFGIVYPAISLTSPEAVSRKSGRVEEMPETTRLARQAYRRVYVALVVRYYGILTGLFLCTFCAWVVAYRIINGLYPWQVNLMANGLLGREQEVVQQVIALLS